MLTQKEIQAQLKVNAKVLTSYLADMDFYKDLAYMYKIGGEFVCSDARLDCVRNAIRKYSLSKSKFLTLSAVQAKLKRMLANTARADALVKKGV